MQIWKWCDLKWLHNDVITKNNRAKWENADLSGTKQNIYRWKGFDDSCSHWIWATVSNVMGIYVNFTKTIHQIWSCHVTLAWEFETFIRFLILYEVLGKLPNLGEIGPRTKMLQTKANWGLENTPSPPPQCL